MLALFDDGTVHYENLGTNYGGFSSFNTRGGASLAQQGMGGNVGGLSFLPGNHLHPAAMQLPLGYDFAAHAAAAYGLQQQPQVSYSLC